jgi:hypothetical protein
LYALRAFIRWFESIDAVEQDLHNKVLSPSLNDGDRERDILLGSETANDILDYLARLSSAPFPHTVLTLLWRCGARSGTVRAFDLCDYDRNNRRLRTRR